MFLSGCYKITTVFSHAQSEVVCAGCFTILCMPTGGKARLTEGSLEELFLSLALSGHRLMTYAALLLYCCSWVFKVVSIYFCFTRIVYYFSCKIYCFKALFLYIRNIWVSWDDNKSENIKSVTYLFRLNSLNRKKWISDFNLTISMNLILFVFRMFISKKTTLITFTNWSFCYTLVYFILFFPAIKSCKLPTLIYLNECIDEYGPFM